MATQLVRDCVAITRVELLNESVGSFKKQGWDGKPWAKRKNDKDAGRGILIGKGSGQLWRSLRTDSRGLDIRAFSDKPYAQAHNKGFVGQVVQNVPEHQRHNIKSMRVSQTSLKSRKTYTIKKKVVGSISTVRAHQRKQNIKLPKRQFLGYTVNLGNRMKTQMEARFNELFNNV
ncbi:phage virion morphogenesis protein [Flexibacter flexilis]|uniref:hypothetical protein n=1 Tax=Flexibacter flexilis TaxID=998 RepID=UPI001C886306|nr:hypothetical protein [Flexibacter flexilis]